MTPTGEQGGNSRATYATDPEALRAFRLLQRLIQEDPTLMPEHREDLRKSGLTDETVARQRICSVFPQKIRRLMGRRIRGVESALLFPFADPAGGFMNHIRLKIFPPLKDADGHTVKYLQPKGSAVRLFFPLATIAEGLHGETPLWLVEGEKKSLAVAQLGLPAVGFCGIQAWHVGGSRDLLPDFDCLRLTNRVVELVPDGDVQTNPHVRRGAEALALAVARRGARPRLVVLPASL